jgi:hypothetical protein
MKYIKIARNVESNETVKETRREAELCAIHAVESERRLYMAGRQFQNGKRNPALLPLKCTE